MKRRSFLKLAVSAPAVLGVPYVHANSKRFAGVTLNINGYGGDYSRLMTEYVAKPLEASTGLKVSYHNSTVSAAVAKLIASKENPPLDVIMADSPNIPELIKADVVDTISVAELPAIGKLLPGVRQFGDYGIPFLTNAVVLTYNTKLSKQPVTSYKDLADPVWANRLGWLSPENTAGLLSLLALAESNGGSLDDMEPAFATLEAMKGNIAAVTPATVNLLQLLEQEEVLAAPFWDGRIYSMRAKGLPMATVIPEEGIYALYNHLLPVKGSRHKEAVLVYMEQALSDTAVNALVDFFRYAPCTDVKLSPEVASEVAVYGENRNKVNPVDWDKVSQMRGELLERFNRAMR